MTAAVSSDSIVEAIISLSGIDEDGPAIASYMSAWEAYVNKTAAFEPETTFPLDIIVADDAPAQRMLLARILTIAGHRIRVAFDGEQALRFANSAPPDLLITDLEMPFRDGFNLIYAIRNANNRYLRQISIIVCSSSGASSLNRALDCGATSFVTKPIHQRELLMAINNLSTV